MTTIAERVIKKCGGHKVVAEWLGISVTSVYRFTYPKERGGGGGIIPAERQQVLLEKAREHEIDLSPADFFSNQESTGGPRQPGPAPAPGPGEPEAEAFKEAS